MRILLSNDDGYLAPGLACLARELSQMADVTVVAPDRDRTAASNSLTLDMPLRMGRAESGFYYVNGTPIDCVHLGITGLSGDPPDMVIAGINAGENLGDDVLYSGTVAVAMEGRFLGFPALAVSLAEPCEHYATAARMVRILVRRLHMNRLPADTILNVNVPDLPYEAIAGITATRLGHRHKSAPVIAARDPRGRPIYWIGAPGQEQDAGPGTDFHAVRRGYVSVTPLQVDLTRYSALDTVSEWLSGMDFHDS